MCFEKFPTIMEVTEEEEEEISQWSIVPLQPQRPPRSCSKSNCPYKPSMIDGLCDKHFMKRETICNYGKCVRFVYNSYKCWLHGGRRCCIERGCTVKEYSRTEHLCAKHYKEHKKFLFKVQREELYLRPKRSFPRISIDKKETRDTSFAEKKKPRDTQSSKYKHTYPSKKEKCTIESNYTLNEQMRYECPHCDDDFVFAKGVQKHEQNSCMVLFPQKKKPHKTVSKYNRDVQGKYECAHCENSFSSLYSVQRHAENSCLALFSRKKNPPKTESIYPCVIVSSNTEVGGSNNKSESEDEEPIDVEEMVYTPVNVFDVDGIRFEESIGTPKEQQLRKEEDVKSIIMNMFKN